MANMIYMREESGIVAAYGDLRDLPVLACSEVLHMWIVTFVVNGMEHHTNKKAPLNHERAFKAIDAVIYAVKNKKWATRDLILYD